MLEVRSKKKISWIIVGLTSFLIGCTNTGSKSEKLYQAAEEVIQASLDAIGKKEDRESLENLVSIADCQSPKGAYTTEAHTASGGYSYFKQTYSYSANSFEAVIHHKTDGFQVGDTSAKLDKGTIYTIRGHEFPNMVLEIKSRFHDFEKPVIVDKDSVKMYQVNAKDELNNTCSLFFDVKTNLLAALHFQNPSDAKQVIITRFSGWKNTEGLLFPFHVDIDQGGKLYAFDYRTIDINVPGFINK